MDNRLVYWGLCLSITLLVLVQIAHIVVPIMDAKMERDFQKTPHAIFYTQEAWDNCAGMQATANKQGFTAWECNDPSRKP